MIAGDVVSALQRAGDPKRSTFASDFAGMDSVSKVDDYTVRVVLKFPEANFLGRISNYYGGNIVSCKNVSGAVFYGAAGFPIANTYLSEFYHSKAIVGGPTAVTNFSDCAVADHEIDQARSQADPKRQLALWKEAQRNIYENACGIPLFELKQV